jgi:hypothetical protein
MSGRSAGGEAAAEARQIDDREQLLREIAALRYQNAALRVTAAALEAEISNLRNSTSWRLTAPLRKTKAGLLGARRFMAKLRGWKARTRVELVVEPQPESLAAWREIVRGWSRGRR